MEQEWLTMPEVCEILRLDRNTVRQRIESGLIPARREGRGWRFRKRDIDAYIDSSWYVPESGEPPPEEQ
jgi:excisionase family DNA binding protein